MRLTRITHVNSIVNPVDDLETIKTEIILSDISLIQKKLEKSKKKLLSSKEVEILEKKLNLLNKGDDKLSDNKDENIFLSSIGLLSIKPRIIVCNVDEKSLAKGNEYTIKSLKITLMRKWL